MAGINFINESEYYIRLKAKKMKKKLQPITLAECVEINYAGEGWAAKTVEELYKVAKEFYGNYYVESLEHPETTGYYKGERGQDPLGTFYRWEHTGEKQMNGDNFAGMMMQHGERKYTLVKELHIETLAEFRQALIDQNGCWKARLNL